MIGGSWRGNLIHRPWADGEWDLVLLSKPACLSGWLAGLARWLAGSMAGWLARWLAGSMAACIPMGFLWDSYGIPMGVLWDSYGIPSRFLSYSYGIPIGFLWDSLGIPIGFL
jgi:hypothetical protein